MKISKRLSLVVPCEYENGTIYCHATPISREVFERYHRVLAMTFSGFMRDGTMLTGSTRTAALALRDVAKEIGQWDGPAGVEAGLVAEIRRLTNAIVPTEQGWQTMPIDAAIKRSIIDPDDAAEVENAITFFTVISAMLPRKDLPPILEGASRLWGGQSTSLNSTEYAASLQTSTPAASTGEKTPRAASSVPH